MLTFYLALLAVYSTASTAGISHANLGSFSEAANCYIAALRLNPQAKHIWSYLRIAFTLMDKHDLVKRALAMDISQFKDVRF